jgi:putative chitinase
VILKPEIVAMCVPKSERAIRENWPTIEQVLESLGELTDKSAIAAAATVLVECPAFRPQVELGGPDYYRRMYWFNERVRHELGNITIDDAVRYCGRGYAQLTGRANYAAIGYQLGLDMLADPDLALEPNVAASIFGAFFKMKRIRKVADAGDWVQVRKLWNGGTNNLAGFLFYVKKLQAALAEARAAADMRIQ